MARKIQISTASPSVMARPETAQYDAMQNLGQSIQKTIQVGGELYQQSKNALTKSQLSNKGSLISNQWEEFNAKQKNNYNEESFIKERDRLRKQQMESITKDDKLTDEAREKLLSSLEIYSDTASRNFNINQSYAMAKSAVENVNEEITRAIREKNQERAKSIFQTAVDDGLLAGDEESIKLANKNIETQVKYYTYLDEIENVVNLESIDPTYFGYGKEVEVTKQMALEEYAKKIDKSSQFDDTQKRALLSEVGRQQAILSKSQAGLIEILHAGINSSNPEDMPSDKDIAKINDPVKRQVLELNKSSKLYQEMEKILGARGELFADIKANGNINTTYFGYAPAWEGKKESALDYEMSSREHLNLFEYNLRRLESTGTILGFVDQETVYSGKRAMDEMWHEVNAIENKDLRNMAIDTMLRIIKEDPVVDYKITTETINSMPQILRGPSNSINKYMDDISDKYKITPATDPEWRSAYNKTFTYLYDAYRYEDQVTEETVKIAMKPLFDLEKDLVIKSMSPVRENEGIVAPEKDSLGLFE